MILVFSGLFLCLFQQRWLILESFGQGGSRCPPPAGGFSRSAMVENGKSKALIEKQLNDGNESDRRWLG